MAQRSRKPRPAGYARSEERNAELRAGLRPLEPGERPVPLVVASVAAALLAVANLVGLAAGLHVEGRTPA